MVSIRLMTYNQESFIREAMDSILMQKIDFPVEIVVGDDFSEDNTLDIIRSYKNTKWIKIKILERKKNDDYWISRQKYGRLYNYLDILRRCKGKYIALLDGDDYWIDPYKLKKQVSFLEENKNYSITSHEVYISKFSNRNSFKSLISIFYYNIKLTGFKGFLNLVKTILLKTKNIWYLRAGYAQIARFNPYTFEQILQNKHFMATSSIMIQRKIVDSIDNWFTGTDGGHYFIVLISLSLGNGYHFKDFMGFHRLHENSISQDPKRLKLNKPFKLKNRLFRLDCLLKLTDSSMHDIINQQIEIEKIIRE